MTPIRFDEQRLNSVSGDIRDSRLQPLVAFRDVIRSVPVVADTQSGRTN